MDSIVKRTAIKTIYFSSPNLRPSKIILANLGANGMNEMIRPNSVTLQLSEI